MRLPEKWCVIGSMVVLLCSCISGHSLRKRRQNDFIFPDDSNAFGTRAEFGGGFRNPQQPWPSSGFRVPFPTPIQPGPPAFIDSPQESSTVTPDTMLTTPSPSFIACIRNCPTTSEYNPICGTNRELYFNEQKFNCALRCGAQVRVWRRGSCEGLFPMMRG